MKAVMPVYSVKAVVSVYSDACNDMSISVTSSDSRAVMSVFSVKLSVLSDSILYVMPVFLVIAVMPVFSVIAVMPVFDASVFSKSGDASVLSDSSDRSVFSDSSDASVSVTAVELVFTVIAVVPVFSVKAEMSVFSVIVFNESSDASVVSYPVYSVKALMPVYSVKAVDTSVYSDSNDVSFSVTSSSGVARPLKMVGHKYGKWSLR